MDNFKSFMLVGPFEKPTRADNAARNKWAFSWPIIIALLVKMWLLAVVEFVFGWIIDGFEFKTMMVSHQYAVKDYHTEN